MPEYAHVRVCAQIFKSAWFQTNDSSFAMRWDGQKVIFDVNRGLMTHCCVDSELLRHVCVCDGSCGHDNSSENINKWFQQQQLLLTNNDNMWENIFFPDLRTVPSMTCGSNDQFRNAKEINESNHKTNNNKQTNQIVLKYINEFGKRTSQSWFLLPRQTIWKCLLFVMPKWLRAYMNFGRERVHTFELMLTFFGTKHVTIAKCNKRIRRFAA